MSKRISVTLLALAIALVASLSLAADAQKPAAKASKSEKPAAKTTEKAPRLTIVEPVKDFGTVAKGEKLDWGFVVKNTGNADLEIIAARPACGCTVAAFDKIIKPGQTGKVQAAVDTASFGGPISKAVTIETNDPSTPQAQLTIHAIVKPYVEAFPAGFVRFNLLEGDAEMQTVTLYSEEEEPFEITKVNTPGDWVKVDSQKVTDEKQLAPNVGRKGQNQYKLNITVGGPDAKIGPLAEKIHVVTNSKHQPDYFITVSGVIRPSYRVDPSNVNFGEVTPTDSAATRVVTIRTNDLKTPEAFEVRKADSSVSTITTAIKPTANKGEYEVTLQLAKNAKPGDIDGKVVISTTDKAKPTFELPIKGTVKAPVAASSASGASK